ncbi:hypothetical protein ACHAW5_000995, partial [Stephanodiscus triporus]
MSLLLASSSLSLSLSLSSSSSTSMSSSSMSSIGLKRLRRRGRSRGAEEPGGRFVCVCGKCLKSSVPPVDSKDDTKACVEDDDSASFTCNISPTTAPPATATRKNAAMHKISWRSQRCGEIACDGSSGIASFGFIPPLIGCSTTTNPTTPPPGHLWSTNLQRRLASMSHPQRPAPPGGAFFLALVRVRTARTGIEKGPSTNCGWMSTIASVSSRNRPLTLTRRRLPATKSSSTSKPLVPARRLLLALARRRLRVPNMPLKHARWLPPNSSSCGSAAVDSIPSSLARPHGDSSRLLLALARRRLLLALARRRLRVANVPLKHARRLPPNSSSCGSAAIGSMPSSLARPHGDSSLASVTMASATSVLMLMASATSVLMLMASVTLVWMTMASDGFRDVGFDVDGFRDVGLDDDGFCDVGLDVGGLDEGMLVDGLDVGLLDGPTESSVVVASMYAEVGIDVGCSDVVALVVGAEVPTTAETKISSRCNRSSFSDKESANPTTQMAVRRARKPPLPIPPPPPSSSTSSRRCRRPAAVVAFDHLDVDVLVELTRSFVEDTDMLGRPDGGDMDDDEDEYYSRRRRRRPAVIRRACRRTSFGSRRTTSTLTDWGIGPLTRGMSHDPSPNDSLHATNDDSNKQSVEFLPLLRPPPAPNISGKAIPPAPYTGIRPQVLFYVDDATFPQSETITDDDEPLRHRSVNLPQT